jgi:hypothetical protein
MVGLRDLDPSWALTFPLEQLLQVVLNSTGKGICIGLVGDHSEMKEVSYVIYRTSVL